MLGFVEFASEMLKERCFDYLPSVNLRLLLCVLMLSILAPWIVQRRRYVRLIDSLPGPRSYFLFGNIFDMGLSNMTKSRFHILKIVLRTVEGCEKLYKKGIFRLWIMTSPIIFISNYKAVETVVGSKTLTHKSSFYKLLELCVGNGVGTSNGKKNKMRKKMINPIFSGRILESFLPIYNKNSWIAVRKIYEKLGDDAIELNDIVTTFTINTLCETILGVTTNAQQEGRLKFAKAMKSLMVLAAQRVSCPHLWLDFVFRRSAMGKLSLMHLETFHDFSKNIIKKRLTEQINLNNIIGDHELPSKKPRSLVDLLLGEHLKSRDFTLQDVLEELNTFLVAGYDTVASSVLWTLYLIGLHPEVQDKIHAEIDEIFADDVERDITAADTKRLVYMERVLKESNRLFPPAPVIGRKITEDTTINGYLVPKDTDCWIFIYALHRDPEIFSEPEKFDPDRFLPENSEKRHPFSYLPFSGGPRKCMGQTFAMDEGTIFLGNLFRHFRIQSIQPRDKFVPFMNAVLFPPGAVLVKCQKRHKVIHFD